MPIIEPECEPTQPITAEQGTPQWIDQVHDNIVRQQECIESWEAAAEAHNND